MWGGPFLWSPPTAPHLAPAPGRWMETLCQRKWGGGRAPGRGWGGDTDTQLSPHPSACTEGLNCHSWDELGRSQPIPTGVASQQREGTTLTPPPRPLSPNFAA